MTIMKNATRRMYTKAQLKNKWDALRNVVSRAHVRKIARVRRKSQPYGMILLDINKDK